MNRPGHPIDADEKFIISGPTEPANITESCGSLGTFLYKRLLRNGDTTALVRTKRKVTFTPRATVHDQVCIFKSLFISLSYFIVRCPTNRSLPHPQIDGVYSTELQYLELLEQAIRLAESLRRHANLQAGDVVGIVSENRLEFPVALYAAFFVGAAVAPINLTYTERKYAADTFGRLISMSTCYSRRAII